MTKPKPRASSILGIHSANTSGRVPATLTTQTAVFTQFLIASTLSMGKKTGSTNSMFLFEVRESSGQLCTAKADSQAAFHSNA